MKSVVRGRYWTVTLSNVHVADDELVWLVTARPTSTVGAIGMGSVPTSVHVIGRGDVCHRLRRAICG